MLCARLALRRAQIRGKGSPEKVPSSFLLLERVQSSVDAEQGGVK